MALLAVLVAVAGALGSCSDSKSSSSSSKASGTGATSSTQSSTSTSGTPGSNGSRPAPSTDATTTAPSRTPRRSAGPASFTLLFAGDLLPHTAVDKAAAAAGASVGRPYDFAALLAPMRDTVSSADLAICHMETPVAPTPARISTYPVFGAPVDLVRGIADTGYDGCSTASNHSLDQGQSGIAATLAAFDALHLGHAGTARSAEEAATTRIYDVKGVKVAHLSYAYDFNGFHPPANAPWSANMIDSTKILAAAKAARAAGAQFVVVSLHWGEEYQQSPNAQQLAVAPVLTASPDIDLVIGHHVHVVQPVVSMNGKFVVFGMGNQISNMTQPLRRDGLTVEVTVTRRPDGSYAATGLEAIPTYVDMPQLRVVRVTKAMADPSLSTSSRSQLQASFDRTIAEVNARGATPGVTADNGSTP
jgi:poly-gamma-glutamate capsule biosynthesis protein CapA/YwtB (metallophosphatase superfamily)